MKLIWKHPDSYHGGRAVLVVFEHGVVSLAVGRYRDGRWAQAITGEPFTLHPIAWAEVPGVRLTGDGTVDREALFAS
jgi:hypothetical protein